jgi:hypothetical protein
VGSGPTSKRRAAPDTLVMLISICEGMLADAEWLARHPDSWRADLVELRDRLTDELIGRARERR